MATRMLLSIAMLGCMTTFEYVYAMEESEEDENTIPMFMSDDQPPKCLQKNFDPKFAVSANASIEGYYRSDEINDIEKIKNKCHKFCNLANSQYEYFDEKHVFGWNDVSTESFACCDFSVANTHGKCPFKTKYNCSLTVYKTKVKTCTGGLGRATVIEKKEGFKSKFKTDD
jgi:hypothetical protein